MTASSESGIAHHLINGYTKNGQKGYSFPGDDKFTVFRGPGAEPAFLSDLAVRAGRAQRSPVKRTTVAGMLRSWRTNAC